MFKTFKQSTSGNVATMFAVSAFTLVIGIGAAIDYSGVTSARQNLQDVIDAATLAAGQANTKDLKELQLIVDQVIASHYKNGEEISTEIKIVDQQVIVDGFTYYDTRIMDVIGRDTMRVGARAGSPIGSDTAIKLALVLDTTDSMFGANITAMRTAANAMVDSLDRPDANVALSVVPFGQYVNVGTNNRVASWLDISKDGTTETQTICHPEVNVITPSVCEETGNMIVTEDIRDGVSFGTTERPEVVCTAAVTEETGNTVCNDYTNTFTWRGCVGSRNAPFNQQAAFSGNRINGVMNITCGSPLLELTDNIPSVKSKISSLETSGDTYMPAGVIWGWRTLQDEEPFKTKVNFGNGDVPVKPKKVMVIMTDGENTRSQGGSEDHRHDLRMKLEANARTEAICQAAKADDVTIYTIGYRLSDASAETKALLRNCASTPSKNFGAANAGELRKVFLQISSSLGTSRLSI